MAGMLKLALLSGSIQNTCQIAEMVTPYKSKLNNSKIFLNFYFRVKEIIARWLELFQTNKKGNPAQMAGIF